MDPRLSRIVTLVKEEYRQNPPPDVEAGTRLQEAIFASGLAGEFSEDDTIAAAKEVGVKEEDISSWLEDMASWL